MARKLPDQDTMLSTNKSSVLDRYMKSASEDVQASYNRTKVPTPEEIMQKSIESYNSIMGIKETAPVAPAAETVEGVVRIKLSDIVSHPMNPYRVHNHKRLEEMTDSIKENGVIEPIIVSSTYGDMDLQGKYICVAGHTRRLASAKAGLEDIPAIVRKMSAEEIDIQVADSNIQREDTLPSEKAKAYRLKSDAMKRQGKRSDLTFSHGDKKLHTDEIIAMESGESKATVNRYLRLSYLLPPLLDYVDNTLLPPEDIKAQNGIDEFGNPIRVIPVMAGVALSYLTEEQQKHVFQEMAQRNIKLMPKDFAEELKAEAKGHPEYGIDFFHAAFGRKFGKKPKAEKKPFSFFGSSKAMKETNAYFPAEYDTAEKRDEVVREALQEYFASRGMEIKK